MKRVEEARAAAARAALAGKPAAFHDRLKADADELLAHAEVLGKPVVARTFRGAIKLLETRIFATDLRAPLDVVDELVAKACAVRVDELRKKSRQSKGMRARHIAIAIAAEVTGYSIGRIARHYGQNHTTAIHARRLIAAAVASNALHVDFFALRERVREELASLGGGTARVPATQSTATPIELPRESRT